MYHVPHAGVNADMIAPAIGNGQKVNILDIIQNELISNTEWRLVRDSQPCDRCIYQFICPPLSNYEEAIGQTNLCHVKNLNLINK